MKNTQAEIDNIVAFLKQTFAEQRIDKAIIAVSGGIDSALSLTLLAKAISVEQIFPLMLPYGDQDMSDAQTIIDFNQIPAKNVQTINIKSIADDLLRVAGKEDEKKDQLRLGNIMARLRMTIIFDQAKKKRAMVVGTENRSEHLLAYYTRFGDSASDIEPIMQLYKQEVRALAKTLAIPKLFLDKAPSAGLWAGQNDEQEMGFSYQVADKVLAAYFDQEMTEEQILASDEFNDDELKQVVKIFARLKAVEFKEKVPYRI